MIRTKGRKEFETTFKKFEEQDEAAYSEYQLELPKALFRVATRGHPEMVADCLKMVRDTHPENNLHVNVIIEATMRELSFGCTHDPTENEKLVLAFLGHVGTEAFVDVVTSFSPSDTKPLISVRTWTLSRRDALDILKGIMAKSAESAKLITEDLPNWLASHIFGDVYETEDQMNSLERAFNYLASFATQDVLERALLSASKNGCYTMTSGGAIMPLCCARDDSRKSLCNILDDRLKRVKARNEHIKGVLSPILPLELTKLVTDYTSCDYTG